MRVMVAVIQNADDAFPDNAFQTQIDATNEAMQLTPNTQKMQYSEDRYTTNRYVEGPQKRTRLKPINIFKTRNLVHVAIENK